MDNGIVDLPTKIPPKEVDSFIPSEPSVSNGASIGVDSVGASVKSTQPISSAVFMKHGVYALQSTVRPFPVKAELSTKANSDEEPLLVIGTTVMDSKVRRPHATSV